ncbi:MAG: GNAT family N-acetyltransferase [Candidatus Sabulitectum sp.]|nr:GNAT family N-acetyltransferase [Candidatus Sabulitectum sp.]
MEIRKYSYADDFLKENDEFLFRNEAANNLIIGIANGLRGHEKEEDTLMYSIRENNETSMVLVMTPPRDLIVAGGEPDELTILLLVNDFIARGIAIPGILAETAFADLFCRKWKEKTGIESLLFRRERVYQLLKCRETGISTGQMRMADISDTDQIADWIVEFHNEIDEKIELDAAKRMAETKIRNKEVFVWIDEGIVSMCASDRESRNGKVINLVYTPPDKRKRGYATSCVYYLCKQILAEGKSFCSLYTDLANQTSNSIYREIGFEPVFDLLHYRFESRRERTTF